MAVVQSKRDDDARQGQRAEGTDKDDGSGRVRGGEAARRPRDNHSSSTRGGALGGPPLFLDNLRSTIHSCPSLALCRVVSGEAKQTRAKEGDACQGRASTPLDLALGWLQ